MAFLAAQVGLDRDTVAEVVEDLKRHGIVTKGHSFITITDHEGLTAACCGCFALCKDATGPYVEGLQQLALTAAGNLADAAGGL